MTPAPDPKSAANADDAAPGDPVVSPGRDVPTAGDAPPGHDGPTDPPPAPGADRSSAPDARRGKPGPPLLCEVAWEVCRQVGGIYTVLRSKAPYMVGNWGSRYCLIGPYDPETSPLEFEPLAPTGPIGAAVRQLQADGIRVHHGRWLVTGQPRVVLLETASLADRVDVIKYHLWEHHDVSLPAGDAMLDEAVLFGELVRRFFAALAEHIGQRRPVLAHFHEWMSAVAVPMIRRDGIGVRTLFTTHATILGRYLAGQDPWFYDHLPFVNWLGDARRMNIEPQVRLERAAAHGSHLLTTVSDVTALECRHLLGRSADVLLPNGLNIERFVAMHEFQNLHRVYKETIHQFVMAHFFPSYSFDLDKTLYFFSSGRYEYRNKGFDLTLEGLARLNGMLKASKTDRTVVFFLVTRRPVRGINAEVLRRRAMLEEVRRNCEAIKDQFGQRLFEATALGRSPSYDELIDDYWRLRLTRLIHAWQAGPLPAIVTHDLLDDDDVLQKLRACGLINLPDDPVKVVYHPDFVTPSSPLFGMDYDQFVRGCHLGIFPSFYEPWGYTPLECVARGVPTVTSDLSGFGTFVREHLPEHDKRGIHVLPRRFCSSERSAEKLAECLLEFCCMDRRDRISQRNGVEACSEQFDWQQLGEQYEKAYRLALSMDA